MAEAPASMKQTIITIGIAAIKIVETDFLRIETSFRSARTPVEVNTFERRAY